MRSSLFNKENDTKDKKTSIIKNVFFCELKNSKICASVFVRRNKSTDDLPLSHVNAN